ncbi:hypothetical protein SC206_18315 [Rouxiella sp. T17]|uniref:hypothetical protein n=1 Tax=Rouxiella sp. T17 TaxID=3085684 RepID=UPI002FC876A5
MTLSEISVILERVRQAYQDSLNGKSVSFTGITGRAVTNHDPLALRKELEYWETRYQNATQRGGIHKLAQFK